MSFKDNLRTWVSEIFTSYNYSHEEKAFTHFFIKNFRYDQEFSDADIRKHVVDNPYDLGVDAAYVNTSQDSVIFMQSKYSNNDSMLDPEIDKADSFLTNYLKINGGNHQTLSTNANRELKQLLENEIFPVQPENVSFIFLCGQFSPSISSRINNLQEKYKENNVSFDQVNIEQIEALYDPYHVKNNCRIGYIPNQISSVVEGKIHLENETTMNVQSCVFSAKATSLKLLYQKLGDALFEANVRNFLSFRKPVNRAIRIEIEKASKSNLWYYNNGIVAVCEGFEVTNSEIIAENLQIVNGGQTVRSISAVMYIDPTLSVNCKLISIINPASVPIDIKREFIANLAINSNKQNPISSRDLRSNDEIQRQLQEKFRKFNIFYQIKDGEEKIDDWKKKLKKEGKTVLNSGVATSFISLFLQKPHSSRGRNSLAFLSSGDGDDVINYENIFGQSRAEIQSVFNRLMFSWLLGSQIEAWRLKPEMKGYPFLYYAQNILLSLYGYWFYLSNNPDDRNKSYDDSTVRNYLLKLDVANSFMAIDDTTCTIRNTDRLREFFELITDKINDILVEKGLVGQPGAISNLFKKETALKNIADSIRPKLLMKKFYLI